MHTAILAVPYDSGFRATRMGAGPLHLLESGLAGRLENAGHAVTTRTLDLPQGTPLAEIVAAFELAAAVAGAVAEAVAAGSFPLVLSGNCGPAALGCVGGLHGRANVFWFDAHGDFNTPETTRSGFLDGMALAAVTGRCWTTLSRRIPGFTVIPENNVTAIGVRDLDDEEAAVLLATSVKRVAVRTLRQQLPAALAERGIAGERAYLHLDLDVLDPGEGRMNQFAAVDGLKLTDLQWAIATIAGGARVEAASVTAFDPSIDVTGQGGRTAAAVILALIDEVSRHREPTP